MALKIKVKRIAGVPSTSNLETGEIGLNTSNNQLYVNISGTITAVGGSGSGDANESSFKTISVSGQSNVVADADDDTLTLAAGSNMTITTNAGSDTITFAATDTTLSLIDEDNLATDSATRPPSQQSVKAYVDANAGGDLSAVAEDIIPDANETRDLGSSSRKWKELHLAGDSIFLGDATIVADGSVVTLPNDSKTADGLRLGATNAEGTPARVVKFYTAAGGLSTANTTFVMKGTSDRRLTFSDFTLASGSAQSAVIGTTVFEF